MNAVPEKETNESLSQKIIIKKPNFLLTRTKKNHYQINFVVENKNIYVKNILNFNFIKLIYEVNKNYFELVNLDLVNTNEANLYLLMKPIMKEIGLLQRFAALKITMTDQSNTVYFKGVPYPEYQSLNQCKNAILAPIKEFTIICNIITPHKFTFTQNIIFDLDFTIMSIFENIFGTLIKNMYQQTIITIENIHKPA